VSSSISRQLVLWLAVPLTLLALCGALAHYVNSIAPAVISSDKRLKDAAAAVIAHRLPAADSVLYAVHDIQGNLIEGDSRLAPVSGEGPATTQIDNRGVRSLTERFDTPDGIRLVTVAYLRSSAEPAARYGFMSTLLWDFVQLDITLVLVWVGIQVGLRPVKRLREEIAARSPQDLRPIDESSVPREIAPAVVTLNRLFGTLRSSAQSQQQFIANTAHQLRTPITGLQAQLELLITESAALPVKSRLLTLQEGIRQLAHSANQLLSLARADPTVNLTAKNQSVALANIAGEVVARFFDRALQAGIDLGARLNSASIVADPSLIDDLLSNLVDNALKYTPAGGSVTVSAGRSDGKAFLSVEDSGPGIAEEYRERVRQRFFRLPNSPGHGSGLGLAIVDEIARLYGATLSIGAGAAGRGARIEVRFP